MAIYVLADRAKSTVETTLLIGDNHVHVKAADYALYPATAFPVTLCLRVGNVESNIERCLCTSKTSPDILNITRGLYGTSAAEHAVGELVQYRVNKGLLDNMVSELQAEIDADITAHGIAADPHVGYALEASGVSMSLIADANIFSAVAGQDSVIGLRGGLNAVGSGGFIQLYGKSHATAGALKLQTPNAAGNADVARLIISGVLATAVATWADITHTGLVLSGDLDCNSQSITNMSILRGNAGFLMYSALLPATAGNIVIYTGNYLGTGWRPRLSISSRLDVAVATWNYVTHTGLKLSGALDANSQTIGICGTITSGSWGSALVRNVDNEGIEIYGGTNNVSGHIGLHGKSSASPGQIDLFTTNATDNARLQRLALSGHAAVAVATWSAVTHTGLKLSGNLDANSQSITSVASLSFAATTGLQRTVDDDYWMLSGGTGTGGKGALITLAGKSHATTGKFEVATPNAAGDADAIRLKISGVSAVAVATWTVVTHTGLKLSGALDANGQTLNNVGEVTGLASVGGLYINGSTFGVTGVGINLRTTGATPTFSAITRLTISADAAVATATWQNITHSGLKLADALNCNTYTLSGVGEITGAAVTSLFINGSPFGATGSSIVFRTTGVTPTFSATVRLTISADAAEATATWANVTHTGLKLSGALDANHQNIINLGYINGYDGLNIYPTNSPAVAGDITLTTADTAQTGWKTRLTISSQLDTAVATWTNITHTGLVLSGAGIVNNNVALQWKVVGGTAHNIILVNSNDDLFIMSPTGEPMYLDPGASIIVRTTNAAAALTTRLGIGAAADTVVATWSAVTHTGLKLSGALDANSQSITSVASVTFVANTGIQRTVDNDYLMLIGGTGTGGKGALITLVGKSHGTTGKLEIATPNAAGNADVTRLVIAGVADIAVATWSNVTHTGLKLSGTLDANDQIISNVTGMSMKGAPQDYCVFNAVDTLYVGMRGGTNAVGSGAFIRLHGKSHAAVGRFDISTPNAAGNGDVTRLSISGVLATAVATWSVITHAGLKLSGTLDCNSQSLSGVTEISGVAAGTLFINGSSWGAAGSAIVLRTASATPTFGATVRLTISTDADVVTASWTAITHTGLKLSSALDFNSNNVSNVWEIYGAAAKSTLYINGSPFGSSGNNITIRTTGATPTFGAIARLTIGSNADEVSADWANITHTGLKLGGTMTLNSQSFDAGAASATIFTTGTGQGLNVKSSTVTSSDGANIKIYGNDTSPAVDDIPASLIFEGMNSTPAEFGFGRITLRAKVVTAGSEDSRFEFTLMDAGASNKVAEMTGAGILSVDLSGSGTPAQVDLFDKYDDALVLRQGIQQNNRELLANMGVLERKDTGSGYMMNLQPMVRLLAGGIYQTRQLLEDTKKELLDRIEIIERKLLEQRN